MTDKALELYSKMIASQALTQDEEGQGTLEYVGMVFVAAALVLMVINGVNGGGITEAIQSGIKKVISNAGGGE
jgi:hypothetical protein